METRKTTPSDAVSGFYDWWKSAGVDCRFESEAINWLAEEIDEAPIPSRQGSQPVEPARRREPQNTETKRREAEELVASAPGDLEAFQSWWMQASFTEKNPNGSSIAPVGATSARTLFLFPQPFEGDRQQLVDGPASNFLEALRNALDLESEAVYLASVMPRHGPFPDWNAARDAGLFALARHHIALVEPERVMLFGRSILPFLANERAGHSTDLDIRGAKIPLFAAPALGELARSAQRRQRFWSRWLDWTATNE